MKRKEVLKEIWKFFPELFYLIVFTIVFSENVYHIILSDKVEASPHQVLLLLLQFVFMVCLAGQYFWKNKVLSIVLSSILSLGAIYMLLAVVSEYQEFPIKNAQSMTLLYVGTILFAFSGLIAIVMPWKYLRM